jgi:hypothetical protein
MKTYPNLTADDIARFKKYAQENKLADWTIGITEDMSLSEVERYLIARCRVNDYKELTPEDIIEFEKSIENEGFSFDFRQIKETITPPKLRKLAKDTITFVKRSMKEANSKPRTVG